MSFTEQFRVDMGLGGTSFGFEVRKIADGEIFNCYGDGTLDQLFIPQNRSEIVITHFGFGADVMNAKYTFNGDLIEAGVFLDAYYNQFVIQDGIKIDKQVKKDLDSVTNDGTDPAIVYINLPQHVIGFISGDDPEPTNNYYSELPYMTENLDGGDVVPVDSGIDGDEDIPEDDKFIDVDDEFLVRYSIESDFVNMHFKIDEFDFITQPVVRKVDLRFLKGTPNPKQVRDLVTGIFPKNQF